MSKFLYRSYVALGDSLTEGLGDSSFAEDRNGKGWADRLATLLSCEAANANENFDYANLGLRGSSSLAILTAQLEAALALKPDLVTIMTGANDLVRLPWRRKMIDHMLRGAISRLYDAGTHVVLVNTVRPTHLTLAKAMITRSEMMSNLIAKVAGEFGAPVVDIHAIPEFGRLDYWAGDLVHFSHRGHVAVTNRVAETLQLELRDQTDVEPGAAHMSAREFVRWFGFDVLPFWMRRLRGVTAGTFLEPKHASYQRLVTATLHAWPDEPASTCAVPLSARAVKSARPRR